jgi:hypothetical protein
LSTGRPGGAVGMALLCVQRRVASGRSVGWNCVNHGTRTSKIFKNLSLNSRSSSNYRCKSEAEVGSQSVWRLRKGHDSRGQKRVCAESASLLAALGGHGESARALPQRGAALCHVGGRRWSRADKGGTIGDLNIANVSIVIFPKAGIHSQIRAPRRSAGHGQTRTADSPTEVSTTSWSFLSF